MSRPGTRALSRLLPRRRTILGVVAGLCVFSSLAPPGWTAPVTGPPRAILHTLLWPVTGWLKQAGDHLRRPPEEAGTRDPPESAMRRQYRQMLVYTRQLEQRLAEARQRIADLSRVRDRLPLAGVRLLPAPVTAWASRRGSSSLRIARGQRHGVAVGQAVADRASLVGRVSDVGGQTASVRLITAPETSLTVRIVPPTGGAVSRQAYIRMEVDDAGRSFTAQVGVDEPVEEGDLAHLADTRWPEAAQGLVVGRVTAVAPWPDDPLLYRRVTVTPEVSLPHLTRVVVLVEGGDEGGDGGGDGGEAAP